jgi:hypothetical protein
VVIGDTDRPWRLELATLAGAVWFARLLCLTRGELTMDGRERLLLMPLNIGEDDDVDILVGVSNEAPR